MIFNGDLCTMSLPNTFSLQLHAPFSPRNDAQHLVRPTAAFTKTAISSSLLHKRMGHRSIQALGIASSSNMWEDTTLNPDNDPFCWGCEITFSRKANHGKTNLSSDSNLKPGSCLMLDLKKNTSKYGLNRATHFPYFLQITDGLTRFTVLLGLSEVSAAAIFECLLHYAILVQTQSKLPDRRC